MSNTYADFFEKVGMYKHGASYKILNKVIDELGLDTSIINKNREKYNSEYIKNLHPKNKIPIEDIFANKHKGYSTSKLKDRLIKEGYKEYKCENCGMTEWLGNSIPLTLHHDDGDRDNNSLDNLKLLCPNCHALTDNFAGKNIRNRYNYDQSVLRNKKGAKMKICPICKTNQIYNTSDMCVDCYRKSKSVNFDNLDRDQIKYEIRHYPMTQVAKIHGVTDNAVRKWCIKLNLPSHSLEIRKYTDEEWEKI